MFIQDNFVPKWLISVDPGSTIYVRFQEFEIEVNGFHSHDCLSTLVIHDGFDASGPELFRGCGLNLPNNLVSTSNGIFVVLNARNGYDVHTGKISSKREI